MSYHEAVESSTKLIIGAFLDILETTYFGRDLFLLTRGYKSSI